MARRLSIKETIDMFSNENGFAWGINTVMEALVPKASYDLRCANETFVIDRWDSIYPQPTSKEIKDLLALALVGGGKTDSQADEIIEKANPSDLMRLDQIAQATLGIAFMPDVNSEVEETEKKETPPED